MLTPASPSSGCARNHSDGAVGFTMRMKKGGAAFSRVVEPLVRRMQNQVDHRYEMSVTRVFQQCCIVFVVVVMVAHAAVSQVLAEVKTVNGRGQYRMGERDTKEDAVRLAVESAKRNALEQVATYVESVTVVDGMDITQDEIRSFTAGLVIVLDQHVVTRTEGDAVVVEVDLMAQVDSEEVAQAIAALRKNEEARGKLATLKRENERLHRELDSANRVLTGTHTLGQASMAVRHRQEILYRVQSNGIVSQAWTDWALASAAGATDRWARSANIEALLRAARDIDPTSPHIANAERMMAGKRPPIPPQPPAPPLPGRASARMPRHEIVAGPGIGGAPRTLNEVIYRAPERTDPNRDRP